jgi:hypothetical protein
MSWATALHRQRQVAQVKALALRNKYFFPKIIVVGLQKKSFLNKNLDPETT